MKSNSLLAVVAAFCGCLTNLTPNAHAASSSNLLFNGNLDLCQAVEIVPRFFLPKPLGWENIGTRTITGPYEEEMSSEPWAGPPPTPVTTNGIANPPPPDGCGGGDCGVFFRPFSGNVSDGSATGHLYQDNPATPGATYLLTAWAGAEANALMGGAELALEFLNSSSNVIAGSVVDLIAAGLFADNGQAFDYKQFSVTATAPANAVTVRARVSMIDATANPSGGGQAFVVDDFHLMLLTDPIVVSQPQSRTNIIGTTATFSVAAVGLEPLSYRWRKGNVNLLDGAHISGSTAPTLTLASVLPVDTADYSVIVSNSFGSVTSLPATLTVVANSANDLLLNGNLDLCQPVEIVPGFFLPKPLGWANAGMRAISGPYEDEMSSEPWAGPAPTPVTTDGSGEPGPNGCGGLDCAVFFKPFSGGPVNGVATGHLYQDVPAAPGLIYTLTGWAGAEANALMARAEFAVEFLNVSSNLIGGVITNLILGGLFTDNGEPFDYKRYTVTATAPSGTVTVRARASMIEAMSNPSGGGQAYVIDDFTLTAQSLVRPRITSISIVQPGGGRRILARGEAARLYTIRAGNSLPASSSWSTLGSVTTDAGGNLEFLDNAAQAPRFYQLLAP